MSVFSEFGEKLRQGTSKYTSFIRLRVLGANNEHLDFVLDSFYKLAPNQRTVVLGAGVFLILAFVLAAFGLYFSRVSALEAELNTSFAALHDLKARKAEDRLEDKRFSSLVSAVRKKTKSLKFKPFFEKLARDMKVEVRSLNEQTADLPSDNPLSEHMKEVQIDMKIPKVSIPRLLKFLIAIERADRYLRVQDLKITGLYGNKLYFESSILVRGYSVN